jgi:hypothetical protein
MAIYDSRAIVAAGAIALLADEVLWQKRLVYLQFGLILLCLGLVMFSRSNATPYLELPAIQDLVQRSSNNVSRHLRLESPPGSPSRPSSRYGFFSRRPSHFRETSDVSAKSPSTVCQSPTPPDEDEHELRRMESPELAEPLMRRAISSPALGQDATNNESDDDGEAHEEMMRSNHVNGDNSGLDQRLVQPQDGASAMEEARREDGLRASSGFEKQARFAPPTPD